MRKKTRKTIFYLAILIFIFLSFFVVTLAFGYKYDFVQNKFLKTGSFQISTNVDGQVYLNEELVGSTSFFTNSFSKGRLLPRTYSVRVQRDGYQSWSKLITVEAGQFASFPKAVLMAEKFGEEDMASSSLPGVISADFNVVKKLVTFSNVKKQTETFELKTGRLIESDKVVLTQDSGDELVPALSYDEEKELWFNQHEIWVKWIKDASYQPYKKTGDEELITRFSQTIHDVQWYKDSAHVIADVGGVLKIIEIDDRDGINIHDISTVPELFYYDKDLDAVFKTERDKVVRIDLFN